WWRIEDVAQACNRQTRLMEVLPNLGEAQDRGADPARQHIEGDQLADRDVAGDDHLGAEIEYRGSQQLVHELDRLAGDLVEIYYPEAGGDVPRKLLSPPPLHLRPDRHCL